MRQLAAGALQKLFLKTLIYCFNFSLLNFQYGFRGREVSDGHLCRKAEALTKIVYVEMERKLFTLFI